MGRLIDADELIEKMGRVKFQTNLSEELHRNRPFLDYADVLGCIYNQPTAYDVEKVEAELEELQNDVKNYWDDDYYKGKALAYEDAIEIVRRGGAT